MGMLAKSNREPDASGGDNSPPTSASGAARPAAAGFDSRFGAGDCAEDGRGFRSNVNMEEAPSWELTIWPFSGGRKAEGRARWRGRNRRPVRVPPPRYPPRVPRTHEPRPTHASKGLQDLVGPARRERSRECTSSRNRWVNATTRDASAAWGSSPP